MDHHSLLSDRRVVTPNPYLQAVLEEREAALARLRRLLWEARGLLDRDEVFARVVVGLELDQAVERPGIVVEPLRDAPHREIRTHLRCSRTPTAYALTARGHSLARSLARSPGALARGGAAEAVGAAEAAAAVRACGGLGLRPSGAAV